MERQEYLAVSVNTKRKQWRDSAGRSGKMKKGKTLSLLNTFGEEGWEMAAAVAAAKRRDYTLIFRRPPQEIETGAAEPV